MVSALHNLSVFVLCSIYNSPSKRHTLTGNVPAQGMLPSAQMRDTAGFYTHSFSQELTSLRGSEGVTVCVCVFKGVISSLLHNLSSLLLIVLLFKSKSQLEFPSLWFLFKTSVLKMIFCYYI